MAVREVRAQCLSPEIYATQISDPVQLAVALSCSDGMQKSPGISPGLFLSQSDDLRRRVEFHQVQTITPVELSQVLADCECFAVALQVCGGPATITAVMVTFCEGVKP
jgi:hypothetical protein